MHSSNANKTRDNSVKLNRYTTLPLVNAIMKEVEDICWFREIEVNTV